MTQPVRARLDAILDTGLDHAPAAELAWLAAERERDPAFDAEVRALLDVQSHVMAWGEHMGAAGGSLGSVGSVEGALAGIFDGLDAGLYDDGLVLDAAPHFDDEDKVVVGLGARSVPAPASAPDGRLLRLMRDNRVAQVLAAAAAVTVVVTAGLSAVRLSAPRADESAMGAAAAPVASAAPAAESSALAEGVVQQAPELAAAPGSPAAAAVAPSRDVAMDRQQASDDFNDADGEAAPLRGGLRGSGGEARTEIDDLLAEGLAARPAASAGAAPEVARAAPTSMSSAATSARPTGSAADPAPASVAPYEDGYYAQGRSTAATPRQATGSAAAGAPAAPHQAEAPAEDAVVDQPAPRYRTWAALRPALEACLRAGHEVSVEIQRGTGAVRVASAPSASAAELRCLRDAVNASAITPPPTVTHQLSAARRSPAAVSDTPTQ